MQRCHHCTHSFSYLDMFKAIRLLTCPACKALYKVEAKSNSVFILTVIGALIAIPYIEDLLPAHLEWTAILLAILLVFLIAPFNQRIEEVTQTIEEKDE